MTELQQSHTYTYEAASTDDVLDEDAENGIQCHNQTSNNKVKATRKPPEESGEGILGRVTGFINRYPYLTLVLSILGIIYALYKLSGLEIEVVNNDSGYTKPDYHPKNYGSAGGVRRRMFVQDEDFLER